MRRAVLDGVGALCLGDRHDHQKGNLIAINAEILELFGLAARWNEKEAGELSVVDDGFTVRNSVAPIRQVARWNGISASPLRREGIQS